MLDTCIECGGDCWPDHERNYRDFIERDFEDADPAFPSNPGRGAWIEAEDELGVDAGPLCASCLDRITTQAWEIREREVDDGIDAVAVDLPCC